MKKTIIVMPVANEESTMGQILDEILELPYDRLYVYPVVDDYSKDRTEAIIREREKHSDKVKCIYYKESTGVISCYLEGFRRALADGAEQILEMDGGLSHLPSEIPQFLEKMNFEKFLSTGHMYQTEMRYYCRNCRTVEVPIHYVGTASSLKGSSVVEALKILFKLKKNERNIWKK